MTNLSITQTDVDNVKHAELISEAGVVIYLYSVYDKLAMCYAPPFTAPNDAVAARLLLASAQGPNSLLEQSPADFDLYHIGNLNTATGVMHQSSVRWCANFGGILQAAMSSGAVKA